MHAMPTLIAKEHKDKSVALWSFSFLDPTSFQCPGSGGDVNMDEKTLRTQRGLLIRLRNMMEQYERFSINGPKLMRGLRYQIAVDATDVNGDTCMFPACGCPKADCSRQSQCRPQQLGAPWANRLG